LSERRLAAVPSALPPVFLSPRCGGDTPARTNALSVCCACAPGFVFTISISLSAVVAFPASPAFRRRFYLAPGEVSSPLCREYLLQPRCGSACWRCRAGSQAARRFLSDTKTAPPRSSRWGSLIEHTARERAEKRIFPRKRGSMSMHDRARRVVLVSIVTASALTTAFGVALSARVPKDCCGRTSGAETAFSRHPCADVSSVPSALWTSRSAATQVATVSRAASDAAI